MQTALITGITGQDGSYLAELLLEQGYQHVVGLVRRRATPNKQNLKKIEHHPNLTLIEGELEDAGLLFRLLSIYRVDECYNLAAQSFVRYSFDNPVATVVSNFIGVVNLLEAIRETSPFTKFYQASTSEMFGGASGKELGETFHELSPFYPRSPYATSKLAAYWHTINMREAHGLFCCNGILFNHESPRRGEEFVTRKIAKGVADYYAWTIGQRKECPVLQLGNLDARRDWGHAKDYVRGMVLMLQQNEPDDYVLATGKCYSVREFVEIAFQEIGHTIEWMGNGVYEIGSIHGQRVVEIDPRHFRPSEVHFLRGNSYKARLQLEWRPSYSFQEIVSEMVESEIHQAELEQESTQ